MRMGTTINVGMSPVLTLTYLEQYAPAWVAELLDLCADLP